MALHTIFGVNGVGKDTVAESLRVSNPDLAVTSMSRLSMYLLGIIGDYDVRTKVSETQYSQLEQTPQKTMIELENNEYRQELEKIAARGKVVLMLSHLVSALRHGERITYLTDRKTPDWFVDINNSLIQLKAPADMICERRKKDTGRDRVADILQINEHQGLCDIEWERIKSLSLDNSTKMHVIENIDLGSATQGVRNVISK
jgi:adenylate kinase